MAGPTESSFAVWQTKLKARVQYFAAADMILPMSEYRVSLDIYNGPLDLLLYLIRRDEVDIYDIPIAAVTTQYVQYVGLLESLDPNMAGEFLVMAATLMEIKTRMLLPTPPPEEGGADGVELDPRAELVRQLLEYKAFKDAAGDLKDAASIQALKFPRHPPRDSGPGEPQVDIEDVQVWDLLDAFDRLMAAIGSQPTSHEVIYDDTPVELHSADIIDRLQRDGSMSFARIFEGRTVRGEIVGLFLAMLELVRRRRIFAVQDANFGDIYIHLNCDPPADEEDEDEKEDREDAAPPPSTGADAGAEADSLGRYSPASDD